MEKYDQHQIDEYLLGNLTGDELASFEKKMKSDPSFCKEINEQQQLLAAVDMIGDLRMKKRVSLIHERATQKTALIRRMNFRAIAIAAVGLFALGLCLWMWLRPPLNERLYADFYEPYPITFSSRSNDADRQLAEASRFYKNGEFGKAAAIFEATLNGNNDNVDRVYLATGICYMELKDNKTALAYFENIIALKDSPEMEQARWYAALIALHKGDISACKNYLETLVGNENGFYYEKATELLSEIEM